MSQHKAWVILEAYTDAPYLPLIGEPHGDGIGHTIIAQMQTTQVSAAKLIVAAPRLLAAAKELMRLELYMYDHPQKEAARVELAAAISESQS